MQMRSAFYGERACRMRVLIPAPDVCMPKKDMPKKETANSVRVVGFDSNLKRRIT